MAVRFPYAKNHSTGDLEFICAWQALGKLVGPTHWNWGEDAMPQCHSKESFASLLDKGREFGLDALCRCLVPTASRNTMQATCSFLETNRHLLAPMRTTNPASDRNVQGVRLTPLALETWQQASEADREALLAQKHTDLEGVLCSGSHQSSPVSRGSKPRPVERGRRRVPSAPSLPPTVTQRVPEDLVALAAEGLTSRDRECFVRALVQWIQREPHQSYWRRVKVGEPVTGWPDRLLSYFWPKPDVGYAQTCARLSPLFEEAALLARALEKAGRWSEPEEGRAAKLALEIFKWGGVPQGTPSPGTISQVFSNALQVRPVFREAPMNSGWTKLAAFATAHLEGQPKRHPQAIWDSRVSTAIVWRLDQLLSAAGAKEVPPVLQDIGVVSARPGSGTRPRSLRLRWQNADGRWRCQFAGSHFVEAMRNVLNHHQRPHSPEGYPRMPLSDGTLVPWAVRGVEMVLFSDGY